MYTTNYFAILYKIRSEINVIIDISYVICSYLSDEIEIFTGTLKFLRLLED